VSEQIDAQPPDGTPDLAVRVQSLSKTFEARGRRGPGEKHAAVHEASFRVPTGGSLGIVGESGSGKTTIARMLVGLEVPSSGTITVMGRDRSAPSRNARERRVRGRELQIVFQDPYTSLDPRQTVRACINETLKLHSTLSQAGREERLQALLSQVGLDEHHADSLPRKLSGGQRQRVAIARSLAPRPSVLVLDEAVSALDVSIQAQILNLLSEIRRAEGMTFIFISHNLAVIRHLTDSAIVLRRGCVVEQGSTAEILRDPTDPYTRELIASVPGPGWKPRRSSRDP
jgi:peptide/nickel transport system ATP-binding protein